MSGTTLESLHFVKGLDPVADAFSGTVYSDVVSLAEHPRGLALIHKGVGATGTSTITVEACDDFVPSNVTAVPFRYRAITSGDTPGEITDVAATGFTTTAGSSQLYAIEVDAVELAKAGYKNWRVKAVEVVDSPVVGAIQILLPDARYAVEIPGTAIA